MNYATVCSLNNDLITSHFNLVSAYLSAWKYIIELEFGICNVILFSHFNDLNSIIKKIANTKRNIILHTVPQFWKRLTEMFLFI